MKNIYKKLIFVINTLIFLIKIYKFKYSKNLMTHNDIIICNNVNIKYSNINIIKI